MPTFEYEAIAKDGTTKTGRLPGDSSSAVVAALAREGMTAVSVRDTEAGADEKKKEEEKGRESKGAGGGAAGEGGYEGDLRSVRVKSEDLMLFTRQLATMVDAGLPIDHAVETLAAQTRSEGFKAVLDAILRDIRQGTRISKAIEEFSKIFPDIYVSMVRAAEASGELARILNQLAVYMESAQRVKHKVKAALTYPVLALFMIVGVAGVLMLVVVPKFAVMFDMIKGKLPLPTVIVMGVSNFMQDNIVVTLLILITVFTAFFLTLKTKRGRYWFDWFKLKVPVFGKLFTQVAIARFSRTLSTLLSSGVPILDALAIVERAAGNAVIAEAVNDSIGSVSGGSGLAQVFETKSVFPPMLVKMIAVGEQTGQLDTLLNKVAEFYDERVTAAVEGLTSMIEPLLIGVLGVVVGGIVMAIFFPMIKLTQSIGGGGGK